MAAYPGVSESRVPKLTDNPTAPSAVLAATSLKLTLESNECLLLHQLLACLPAQPSDEPWGHAAAANVAKRSVNLEVLHRGRAER